MANTRITKADQFYATQWLHVMLNKDDWLSDQFDEVLEARNEFKKICLASKPDKLNDFIDRWLSPQQREELDKSIAAARKRREKLQAPDEHHAGVHLTHRANFILENLARQENCTVSEVIERHLVDLVECEIPEK